ncbi:hypothetical protein S7711_09179 [Stachybotrys chartarum IBT 7711]|uniref:D-isomer specific 2-hydroxyacid dehydrogenase NAD-binding domain-containing protein n=1 Tax=Stachybotrys chartarum (strain CBS 109288 / IBT 7711) TaxID=1280523 RepID=A0A084ALS2_STACB|nr:hypothetical protein S7711_09179 [Stachybotrys chartarum IBT 7711]KFA46973.1 hypothetical protein S40293_09795 [Stachybotrys chartarum IBT 40293]
MAEPTNTPVPASTPRSTSPVLPQFPAHQALLPLSPLRASRSEPKLRVLHIGDPIRYNPQTYSHFSAQFDVVRPEASERGRAEFIQALKEKRWGEFHAIFRPFWGSGGEMGRWDAELIDLLPPTVKVFASAGAGFDWADTELLGKRGIVYCNSGLAAAEAVADFAVAMIISTFRHLPWCMASATSGDAAEFQTCHDQATAQSHNLRGHVLGLIALGNVGQQIAARCYHGFGMNIHYHDIERKAEDVERGLSATYHPTMESLIRASDCVVLCAPAGQGSFIHADSLRWFRPGARFVNVARGILVEDDALVDALERNQLSTVALDVHENEPNVHERLRYFASQGRAMLTCHNAGGTVETHRGFEELSMRNIMAVLNGGQAITPVNMQHLRK